MTAINERRTQVIIDSAIEYIEQVMGVGLSDYQKEMLKVLLILNEKMWWNDTSHRWVFIEPNGFGNSPSYTTIDERSFKDDQ